MQPTKVIKYSTESSEASRGNLLKFGRDVVDVLPTSCRKFHSIAARRSALPSPICLNVNLNSLKTKQRERNTEKNHLALYIDDQEFTLEIRLPQNLAKVDLVLYGLFVT